MSSTIDQVLAVITGLLALAVLIALLGWAVVRSLEDQGFDTLTIPGVRIAVIAALGAVAGTIVATPPARCLARLDILDALSTS